MGQTEIRVAHTLENTDKYKNYIYGAVSSIMSDINATKLESSIAFTGETNITLLPNAKTIAFGLASFAGGRITANEHVSVSVNNESYNGFYGLRTGKELRYSYSYVTIKNGLTIKLPTNIFPGTDNTYAAFADKYGIIDIKDGNSTSGHFSKFLTSMDTFQIQTNNHLIRCSSKF